MKSQKSICLLLCFTIFLSVMPIFSFSAPVLAENEDTAETIFNFDDFDFSDPSLRIDNFPKDDEFFGAWDSENEIWTKAPKFNYEHVSQYGGYNMKAVESFVKNGDYENAKAELLKYYRSVNSQRGVDVLAPSQSNQNLASLLLYNMHDMVSSSYYLAGILELKNDMEWIGIDVLDTIEHYIDMGTTTKLPIGLYGLTKDGYEALFCSNDSDYAPYIEMVVDGVTETVPVSEATYIRAGDYANDNFGDEEYIRVCESPSTIGQRDPVDSETKRGFMMFDLSKYDSGNTITYAQLKIRGCREYVGGGAGDDASYVQKVAAVADINTNWTEEILNWETNATLLFSYAGEKGVNWIQPTQAANADQMYEEHLIRFAWLPALTATYVDSGDETYSRAFFLLLHDFIEETYNVYRGMEGGWEYPAAHNSVEEAMQLIHGGYSKSLDLSVRAANLAEYLPYYFESEYMTPELFTVFTKYMWAMGDLISRFWGRSEKAGNWGNYSNKGFFAIMSYYPEFADACDCSLPDGELTPWRQILNERVVEHATGRLLEDGSSEEGSTSYTWSNLNNLYATKEIADKLGIDLVYPQEAQEGLARLAQYCTNLLLPWGGDPGFGDCVPHTGDYHPQVYKMGEWLNIPEFLYIGSKGEEGTKPDYTSAYYDFRKFMIMRSGWDSDAHYLYTSNSSSPYSHNHYDDLNVIVAAYGAYLLIDPGYYTLENNDLNGRRLKSSLSHNTISINGYSTKKYTAPHLTGDAALAQDGTKGDFEYVEFNDHYNFVREVTENNKSIQYGSDFNSTDPESTPPPFEPGMDSARNILFLRPNFWIVSDYMKPVNPDGPDGNGNTYYQYWHTLPESGLAIDGQYVLQDGEQVGDINEGEFASEIENTHFVPGTGDGTISTNVHSSANIMVVPADVKQSDEDSGVTPKLLRGLYSPMKGSVVTTPYGAFERTEKGTTVFDTILFPTRKGEKYDITTTPNTVVLSADKTELAQGAASSFSANIKNISGHNNDDYNFTYYILHETDIQTDVKFGDYSTDGMLAYYEEEKNGKPRNAIMKNATYIGDEANEYKIVYSKNKMEDLSVKWENGEIILATEDEIDISGLTIYSSSEPTGVFLNDEEVEFSYTSNYVYFGDEPILNGDSVVLPETPSVDSSEEDEETPTHGSSTTTKPSGNNKPGNVGGGSSGGSIGGGNIGGNVTIPSKSDAFAKELTDHWGKKEIAHLIDSGIVNGDESGLNLKSNITRAEFVAMVVRALKLEIKPYKGSFADVSESDWYANIIQTAYDANIISGTDKGAEPNSTLTREQAVKIMLSALKIKADEESELNFADADNISDWAKPFVAKSVELGLINGMGDNLFAPKHFALREQAMVMIYRMLEKA
ncbi:MAG: DNRLRE domain-containing protein [Ruminococcaceae bacterium]|nr:DNRLRE domain-containing protein [Oscillospiraceae bacterium]